MGMPHRPLGASGLDVSALALGSWQTYEHIPREQAVAVMAAARDAGIDFLDDARYDDRTGRAPIPTGYSEVLFGDLFRAVGWKRDEVVVSTKLWWEFWPGESAVQELDGSLRRMGFDYLDLVYSWIPPEGLGVDEVVRQIGALVAAGKVRAWGVGNWPAEAIAEAVRVAAAEGLPPPCAAQLPYSLLGREWVEAPSMVEALDSAGASVVASYVLEGGVLTGKYREQKTHGRVAGELHKPARLAALTAAEPLFGLAERLGTTPAVLAIAFCLSNPRVATVLFGSTTPEQVAENCQAVELLDRLGQDDLAELGAIGASPDGQSL